MFSSTNEPTPITGDNHMTFSKTEKFAIEIRCKDRANVISQKRAAILTSFQTHFSDSIDIIVEKVFS